MDILHRNMKIPYVANIERGKEAEFLLDDNDGCSTGHCIQDLASAKIPLSLAYTSIL